MPESSAWPDIRRWGELHNTDEDLDDGDHVVVHNELYVSEGEEDFTLRVPLPEEEVELEDSSAEDRSSHISGISQQDRDNKTILLRQAASGNISKTSLKSIGYSIGKKSLPIFHHITLKKSF